MKKLVALLLAAVMVFSLTACGGSGNPAVGKYGLEKMSAGGMEFTADDLESLMSLAGVEGKFLVVELTEDGKFIMTSEVDESMNTEGTYTIDGNTITITAEGSDISGTIDGDTITLTDEASSTEMVLSKE